MIKQVNRNNEETFPSVIFDIVYRLKEYSLERSRLVIMLPPFFILLHLYFFLLYSSEITHFLVHSF